MIDPNDTIAVETAFVAMVMDELDSRGIADTDPYAGTDDDGWVPDHDDPNWGE